MAGAGLRAWMRLRTRISLVLVLVAMAVRLDVFSRLYRGERRAAIQRAVEIAELRAEQHHADNQRHGNRQWVLRDAHTPFSLSSPGAVYNRRRSERLSVGQRQREGEARAATQLAAHGDL